MSKQKRRVRIKGTDIVATVTEESKVLGIIGVKLKGGFRYYYERDVEDIKTIPDAGN